MGVVNAPEHRAGTVEKCTLCNHRLEEGREPACVEGCPNKAIVFEEYIFIHTISIYNMTLIHRSD